MTDDDLLRLVQADVQLLRKRSHDQNESYSRSEGLLTELVAQVKDLRTDVREDNQRTTDRINGVAGRVTSVQREVSFIRGGLWVVVGLFPITVGVLVAVLH